MNCVLNNFYKQSPNTNYVLKGKIGSGSYSNVYDACIKNKCNAIAKVQKKSVSKDEDILEIYIQKYLSDISPDITRIDTCLRNPKKYIIYMEKMKCSLNTYLNKMPKASIAEYILYYTKECIKLLKKMHRRDIYHGDCHLENFVLDKNNKLFLIDYGFSCPISYLVKDKTLKDRLKAKSKEEIKETVKFIDIYILLENIQYLSEHYIRDKKELGRITKFIQSTIRNNPLSLTSINMADEDELAYIRLYIKNDLKNKNYEDILNKYPKIRNVFNVKKCRQDCKSVNKKCNKSTGRCVKK
jgi:serine/threonine protein kinase